MNPAVLLVALGAVLPPVQSTHIGTQVRYFHSGPGGSYEVAQRRNAKTHYGTGVFATIRVDRNDGTSETYDYYVNCKGRETFVQTRDDGNKNYIDPEASQLTAGKAKYYDNVWHYICRGTPFAND